MAKSDGPSAPPETPGAPPEVRPLPPRASLEHLKNQAKKRLDELRRDHPRAKLTDAQYAIAKQYGFTSWRALKDAIDGQSQQRDALLAAVKTSDVATLRSLLDAYPQWVDAAVEDRQTRVLPTDTRAMRLLHVAVAENQPEVARLLLERGANPNVRNADGRTPLHDCIEIGRDTIRQMLLDAGAEIDVCAAAVLGRYDRLRELLAQDPALANDHSTNLSPMGWAAYGLQAESVHILLDHGGKLDPPFDYEVLHPTAQVAATEVLKVLLSRGVAPDWRGRGGDSLLHLVLRSRLVDGPTEFVRVLLDAGGDVNAANDTGTTPLDEALAQTGRSVEDYATGTPQALKRMDGVIELLRSRGAKPGRGVVRGANPRPLLEPVLKAFGEAIYRDRGDVEAVRELLDEHPALVNSRPWAPRWDSTAIEAVAGMCVWHRPKMHQIAKLLVERGAEADLPTLARAGLLDEVKRRLDADPSLIDVPDAKGRTALYRGTCVYGSFPEGEAVAKLLIERGATVDVFSAATLGMVGRVREILEADPSQARAYDGDGMTALHWSVRPRHSHSDQSVAIPRLLLDAGADVEAVNQQEDGMHPLHHCGEWMALPEAADLLIERGANINARAEKNGWTPLDYAIDRNRMQMIEHLRARGGSRSAELDHPDDTPAAFLKAVWSGDGEVVRRMLAEQPKLVEATAPHPQWRGRPQALHLSIERGDRATFDLLLNAGAPPGGDNREYDGWSPLMLAIHWKRDAMRDELIRRGAQVGLVPALMLGDDARVGELLAADRWLVHYPMPNRATALHFATTVPGAARLVEMGVPLDTQDKYGKTALDLAAERKQRELVDFLCARGAAASAMTWARLGDLEQLRRSLGRTRPPAAVAIAAVEADQLDVVRWLLAHGVDVNTRDAHGSRGTLLHAAAWNGHLAVAQLLVDHGADLHAVDDEHRTTPLAWAETARKFTGNERCDEVADYLKEAMAKPNRNDAAR